MGDDLLHKDVAQESFEYELSALLGTAATVKWLSKTECIVNGAITLLGDERMYMTNSDIHAIWKRYLGVYRAVTILSPDPEDTFLLQAIAISDFEEAVKKVAPNAQFDWIDETNCVINQTIVLKDGRERKKRIHKNRK